MIPYTVHTHLCETVAMIQRKKRKRESRNGMGTVSETEL